MATLNRQYNYMLQQKISGIERFTGLRKQLLNAQEIDV
jgi:hypothetical protein